MDIADNIAKRVDNFDLCVQKFNENPTPDAAESVCINSRSAWAELYRQALVGGGIQIGEDLAKFQKAIDDTFEGLKRLESSKFKSAYKSEIETRQRLADLLRRHEFDMIRDTLSERAEVGTAS